MDVLQKQLSDFIQKGAKKASNDNDKILSKMMKDVETDLVGSMKGQPASGVLDLAIESAKRRFKSNSVTLNGKEIPLEEVVKRASKETVFKKIFVDGDIDMVRKAKIIYQRAPKDVKDQGMNAWNDVRGELFGDMLKSARENQKGKFSLNPDKIQKYIDDLGPEKFDVIFNKAEQKIIRKLSDVDDRTILEITKGVLGGPRLSYTGRFYRAGMQILVKSLFQSKETQGFAGEVTDILMEGVPKSTKRKVAEHLGRNIPINQIGSLITGR